MISGARRTPPKLGLALGGGVARGWAHIGVIRALIRAGIEPDVVCGTSIGALVGGCYLAGRLDALEGWARSLSRRRMLGYLDVVVGGNGLLRGKRLAKLMDEHLHGIRIEDLDRDFVAVTGELATGHEVWLEDGLMTEAIQASYALPGVFGPKHMEGRWLIDGALVNPVPVSVCRAKGARVVIAVTLNADAFGKGNLPERSFEPDVALHAAEGPVIETRGKANPQRMMMRQLFGRDQATLGIGTVLLGSLNIVMDRLSRSRMAGDPPDILVTPQVGHRSLLDFDKADELIALGEEALERQLPAIREVLAVMH